MIKYIITILLFIITFSNLFVFAGEDIKSQEGNKEDKQEEKSIYFKITDITTGNLKGKIADDKLETLDMLKKIKFSSQDEFSKALAQLGFTEEEIEVISDEARVEEATEEEKTAEACPVDLGNIRGTIVEVFEVEKEIRVKINIGTKNGMDREQDKGRPFTVEQNRIPIAIVKLLDIGEEESLCEIDDILEGITLNKGEQITSEGNDLEKGDLIFLNNPYCQFISKTAVAGGDKLLYQIEPVYSNISGDNHLLTCYGHNDYISSMLSCFGIFGKVAGMFVGSNDDSFIYLFDDKGEKKWGYEIDLCIFRNTPDEAGRVKTKPDYKTYSDRLYFNSFNVRKSFWGSGYVTTSGILFGINYETGQELWRLKDSVFGFDPVLYSLIYDNFVDKVCYLYSSKSSLYAVDLTNGEFIWEFKMHSDGIEKGVFDATNGFIYAADKDGYFYRVDTKNGLGNWELKTDAPAVRIEHSKLKDEHVIYIFDNKKSIYAVDTEKGNVIWKYDSVEPFTAPQLNTMSGDLIYTYDKGGIEVISRITGQKVWRLEVIKPSPLYSSDGKIFYCISDGNFLCAIDTANGSVLWKYKTEKDITRVLPEKGTFYILDKRNVYALDMSSGREIWKKTDFKNPVYLEKQKEEIDPYSITELGKVEEGWIFIGSENGFLCINPGSHQIVLEQKFDEDFVRALGDPRNFYLASEKHIWAVDTKTGKIKWDKAFQDKIKFIPTPPGGESYYSNDDFFSKKDTINSMSKILLGLQAGDVFYLLNRETGDIVSQGDENETIYPYLEMEGMNKGGEKVEGVYFYYYKGSLYALRSKNTSGMIIK